MIKTICEKVAANLNNFTIAKDDVKYLTRYYLLGKDRKLINIYLHKFHRSDLDKGINEFGLLHNHPWKWSFGFILVNGYMEERRLSNGNIVVKLVKPFNFNFLTNKDFHRVDLLGDESWSIFITGSRSEGMSWGFYDRVSKEYTDWTKVDGAIE